MTLTEFLLARYAEDEAAARALHVETALPAVWSTLIEPGGRLAIAHIARWDPARVLAECEAKRQIVEDLRPGSGDSRGVNLLHSLALEALAAVYADHPDYRQEWAP